VCYRHGNRHRYKEGKIQYDNEELEGNTVFLHSALHQNFLCRRHEYHAFSARRGINQ
jgi:hypothetical protein